MTVARPRLPALLLALALAGCGEKKPMLTLDVAAAAAERCGGRDFQFTRPGDSSEAPSFSYLDPGPAVAGKPTQISTCLAEALKDYRFASMKIRFEPGPAPGGAGN